MVENAFYFILKALSVLKIFKIFILTFWSCGKNCLIRKIRLISKFMTSQPGRQTNTIHIMLHSLLGSLYVLRYWATYALQLFASQVVTSQILKLTLPGYIEIKLFCTMSNLKQKFKYLDNKKSF